MTAMGHRKPLRVIQFSTGNVGIQALRSIIERPDLELVGLHAQNPAKIGTDAAEICGLDTPTGVVATDDVDALVALGADCVVYCSQAELRPDQAQAELIAFLEAGTNVVGTSLVWLVAPDQADDWLRVPLAEACARGNSTLYVNGIDPGFSGDTLVYAALSLAGRATAITVQEIFDYGGYADAEFTGVTMGFGASPDHTPLLFEPGVLASLWGGQVRSLADDIGIELDEVRERHETWTTPERIDCIMMTVPPGGVAAVRFGVDGVREGRTVITMEHVNRLTERSAPDWAFPPHGYDGVHRVVIEGNPGVEMNTHVGLSQMETTIAGVVSTAARVVNAIGAVCEAPSGLLAAHDLRPRGQLRGTMW